MDADATRASLPAPSPGYADHLAEHRALFATLDALAPQVQQAADAMAACLQGGGKLLFCGNGGSAADAQHLAAEFTGRFVHDRRPLPAIALAADASTLTCIANDYDFSRVFERPLRALARPGDLLVGISTSGRSANVLRAVEAAAELGLRSVGLLGRDGGAIAPRCEITLVVPSPTTARIQEAHIFIGHTLCALVERALGC